MRFTVLLTVLVAGCGTSSITSEDVDGGAQGFVDASFDARLTCTSAQECATAEVCNPANSKCTANLPCTTHAQCGNQAFCSNGKCAHNVLRGVCDNDNNCVGQETCEGGHCGCGGEVLSATVVAPNMLIALDRSDSMVTNNVPGTGDSRWVVARRVLKALTLKYQGGIRFGLMLWPGNEKQCEGDSGSTRCKGSVVGVAMGPSTATAIGSYVDTATTCNLRTPIGGTMDGLVGFSALGDTARDNYVVLVTDGDENCSGDGPGAATDLAMRTPPVKTFVIGFGGEVNADTLNAIAVNGGTARAGTTKYYQADNEAALDDAFEQIAGAIASCTYTLSGTPDDATRISVFLGQTQIPRDTSKRNGWDFEVGPKRLTFYGAACDQVRSGTGGALAVTFGCPIVP